MLGVQLLLHSGHRMLVIGLDHPPKFKYEESDLIDAILGHCDVFLDSYPYGVILCGGDVNKLNLDQLSTLSGLAALVDFPTRGNSILDNCLTIKPELYDQPFLFQALIKTDHGGAVLPPGKKFKPIRTKHSFRDYKEHRKIHFSSLLQKIGWSSVVKAKDIDSATNLLNDNLHSLMNQSSPARTVSMSTRDPPWITPLLKHLLIKKKRAADASKENKARDLSGKVSRMIAENRRSWGG